MVFSFSLRIKQLKYRLSFLLEWFKNFAGIQFEFLYTKIRKKTYRQECLYDDLVGGFSREREKNNNINDLPVNHSNKFELNADFFNEQTLIAKLCWMPWYKSVRGEKKTYAWKKNHYKASKQTNEMNTFGKWQCGNGMNVEQFFAIIRSNAEHGVCVCVCKRKRKRRVKKRK